MDTDIHYGCDSFTQSENLETFGLIWLDANPNNMEKSRNTERQMRDIINHFRKFEDLDKCKEYIEQASKEDRLVLIVSDELGRELVPRIHRLQQVSSIYVYGMNSTVNGRWTSQFTKIKVSTVQLDKLLVQIKSDQRLRARVQEPFSAHIFNTGCVSDKSTTEINGHTKREVADIYLYRGDSIDNLELVLFEIDAAPHVGSTKPFAYISPYSNFPDESEVLFTLGSVFRLISISAGDDNLWTIRMELCTDDEHSMKYVLSEMRNKYRTGETSLHVFAKLLAEMGKFDLAEKYYRRLHNEIPSDDPSQKDVCNELATVFSQKGELNMSMEWRVKASKIPEYRNLRLEKKIFKRDQHSPVFLRKCRLCDRDMKIVAQQAIVVKKCTLLDLADNNITPEGLLILANALHHNRKLEKLDLSCNTISDIGVSIIAHSIKNSTVTILVLDCNRITDEGARYLAEMLRTNKILVYLGLSSNCIGEQGVNYLADALTTCNTTLKELSLQSNKFLRDSSIDSLFAILKYNNALDTLDISGCNMSTVGIARLQDEAKQKSSFHFVTTTTEAFHHSHPASSWVKVFLSRIK
ncbi:unnamed protein product [Rotaria socialis]|uniref:Uncharacterized protein n=1 Tax=Rotaria socialis TaxID=392032 RepID=A0A819AR39_9BILA|nr:unnamed protein product [Rotaria socialis]CAF4887965.1 unnamed protein product [Rotaria socialis]